MIKFFKKLFCKHKWEIFKEENKKFTLTIISKQARNPKKVISRAYKCKECGRIKFWYSYNIHKGYFRRAKKDFEFKVFNKIKENK